MKPGFLKIFLPVLLLLSVSAQAADQQSPAAAPEPAIAAGASGGAQPAGETAGAPAAAATDTKQPVVEETHTITLKIPLFSPTFATTPVAEVNGDDITVDELMVAIGAMHEGIEEQKTTAGKSYTDTLNRLINIKLMVQEARNIELDQLPEVKFLVNQFEKATLKELLFREQTKDIRPDEDQVEKLYRERIKEWKLTSYKFAKEADAKKIEQEIRKGGDFVLLMEKAVKDGLAQGSKEASTLHAAEANTSIAKAIEGMKAGAVSPVVPVDAGFAIFRLEAVSFPENAEIKKQAAKAVYDMAKLKVLKKYLDGLVKKYVKIDAKLLKKLDFEAPKPGFAKMLDDKRVIARIKGEKPVTVADLAQAINERFFHGVDSPIKEKKVNVLKRELLDNLIAKQIIQKEALAKGIDKTPAYLAKVKDYKETVTFGVFIEKVIRPEVRFTENDLKSYYEQHAKDKEFTYPGMVRINGLAFTTMEAAQASVDKLRQGVDFKWLKSTSEGQVAEDAPDLLNFEGNLVATTTLPDDLNKILTGVHSNDYRLYADAAQHYYALQIKDYIPPRAQTYEEARDAIKRKVYNEHLRKSIDDWTNKLRAAADIKVYADFGEIR